MAVPPWAPASPELSTPFEMAFGPSVRQRRVTVFFRPLLVIPQVIVLYFVGIAAFVVVFLGWFAALFTGRLPDAFARFILGYLRWRARVDGYSAGLDTAFQQVDSTTRTLNSALLAL